MMQLDMPVTLKRYKAFCAYGGSGLGAMGLQWAKARFADLGGEIEVIGSVDVDPYACKDFEMLTGVKATPLDLFDRQQYMDWHHGKEPPADWREATCDDLQAAAQHQDPDIVLITAPCKGLSGLLSQEKSDSRRYQALNKLTYRGVFMVMETWKHNLPGLIFFENVPRISTRGRKFLDDIKALLRAYGYVLDERHHDLGPIGGLGQHRKRYLLVARNPAKVTSFLYYPPKLRLKSIGEVMEQQVQWMPDDPAAGPMHRLPRLQWKTWVRLALIPPGGDWRNLQNIKAGQYRITAEINGEHTNKYRVYDSTLPAGTVTGSDRLGSGAPSVADPRIGHVPMGGGHGAFWVQDSNNPSGTITADPSHRKSGGASCVADPRIAHEPRDASMRVGEWDKPSGPVVGSAAVTSSNGIGAVADPRLAREPRAGVLDVQEWDKTGHTVTGGKDPNGTLASVADPRADHYKNFLRVNDFEQPANTVTGAVGPNQGANLVADPRLACAPRNGTMGVIDWGEPGSTVLGAGDVHAGAAAVADPRDHGQGSTMHIPADDERGVWFIRSPHKDKKGRHCIHRPMTTMELLALQSVPVARPDGSPVVLAGSSNRSWRERIGNGLPPAAMKAIGEMALLSLLPSEDGEWILSPYGTPVWVRGSDGEMIPLDVAAD